MKRRRYDHRFRLTGSVLAETGTSVLMRVDRHPGGADGRPVLVVVHEDLSSSEVVAELRLLADQLHDTSLGLRPTEDLFITEGAG